MDFNTFSSHLQRTREWWEFLIVGWGHLTTDGRHGEAADQTVFCLTGGDKEAVRTKQPLTSPAHISSLTAAEAVVKQKVSKLR
ncbi:hypothetical protein PBY51_018671 [Eleginops maclovinus]|uniref:Uncharacterized protein n=1 Tax=Eleginops maclovinus TaxID=56733 RepID=A0AAN7Y0R7_ELEMC|nr:hypothetical protein PBY51_018671 [Eleginops maclovinus]